MIRIRSARMSFRGLGASPERASAIAQGALRQVSARAALHLPGAPQPRMQLTVRVPRGASDAAIAARVAQAVDTHLDTHLDAHLAARGDRRGGKGA